MTAVPLTSDALTGIKRSAREAFPLLGSSHLSEAIAAGLGYGSHAALLRNLDQRPNDDPDYAYWDDDEFVERAEKLSGAQVDVFNVISINFAAFGGINTYSRGAGEVDLTKPARKRAWRNAMVAAINAGLGQRLFTILPGDNRWDGWNADRSKSAGMLYNFSIEDIPAAAWVSDAGYDELSIHVSFWPDPDRSRHVAAMNAGFYAGDVFASGWLERQNGAWLQVGKGAGSGWTFKCRRARLATLSQFKLRPRGYAAEGSFIL